VTAAADLLLLTAELIEKLFNYGSITVLLWCPHDILSSFYEACENIFSQPLY